MSLGLAYSSKFKEYENSRTDFNSTQSKYQFGIGRLLNLTLLSVDENIGGKPCVRVGLCFKLGLVSSSSPPKNKSLINHFDKKIKSKLRERFVGIPYPRSSFSPDRMPHVFLFLSSKNLVLWFCCI